MLRSSSLFILNFPWFLFRTSLLKFFLWKDLVSWSLLWYKLEYKNFGGFTFKFILFSRKFMSNLAFLTLRDNFSSLLSLLIGSTCKWCKKRHKCHKWFCHKIYLFSWSNKKKQYKTHSKINKYLKVKMLGDILKCWIRSGVFGVNFEHIPQLVFLSLTLNRQVFAGRENLQYRSACDAFQC